MRVIIIDDNRTNLLLFQGLVSQLAGCESLTFDDPLKAIDWCTDNGADLVLTDYMMPEMDGLEVIARIRRMNGMGDVPIVMVTTTDLKEIRYEALQRGATDFLNKPVDATEFMARMTNLLELRRNQIRLKDRASWLAEEVAKATATLVERENEIIWRLSKAAEYRDPETGAHILRMANYCRLIAEQMQLPWEQEDMIFRAAPMHDIGKVGIVDEILLKPGRLTPEEFETMKDHTRIGQAILQNSPSQLLAVAAEIAISHHEKFDGSGYPRGLRGEEIPLGGRIVAVADVFDALTSARPYKEPWSVEQASDYIRENTARHFDPQCVDAFFQRFPEALSIRDRYKD
ncbi:MAG: response regulator [Magnetospirillum sp. WYHS-4]